MDLTPITELTLTESELRLIADLLEREQTQLPTEIRHTKTRSYRLELQDRLHLVEGLLARMKPVPAT